MKRYLIAPIIGDGSGENPYRPSVADLSGVNSAGVIPTDPQTGIPKYGFALCIIGSITLDPLSTLPNLYVFPDYPLDGRMDGMQAATRTAFVQSVEAYDLDGLGLNFDTTHIDSDAYRDVILGLLQQLEPVYSSVDQFDVSEPEG